MIDKKLLKKWMQNAIPNESVKRVFRVDKIDHKNDFFCPHCEVFTGKNRYCPKCKQLCF